MNAPNPERNPHEELRASNSNQHGDDGIRDTSPKSDEPEGDTPPEQSPGNVEENPTGIPPKAGYPSKDPRSSHGG
jgi:hypothetical protein